MFLPCAGTQLLWPPKKVGCRIIPVARCRRASLVCPSSQKVPGASVTHELVSAPWSPCSSLPALRHHAVCPGRHASLPRHAPAAAQQHPARAHELLRHHPDRPHCQQVCQGKRTPPTCRRCSFQQVWRALGSGITLLLLSTAQLSPGRDQEGMVDARLTVRQTTSWAILERQCGKSQEAVTSSAL